MANIDGQQMRWNGKLSGGVDLLYYDKENVDVVHPPYSGRHRNSSFFFKTRKGYVGDAYIYEYLRKYAYDEKKEKYEGGRKITDVKILWEDGCKKENGIVYYYCEHQPSDRKYVLTRRIIDGCLEEIKGGQLQRQIKSTKRTGYKGCKCSDDKMFTTTYVKGEPVYFLRDSFFKGVSPRSEIGVPAGEVTPQDLMNIPDGFSAKFVGGGVDKNRRGWQDVTIRVWKGSRDTDFELSVRVYTDVIVIDSDYTSGYDGDVLSERSSTGIQINRKEGGVVRGYMSDQSIIDGEYEYTSIKPGDYIVVFQSDNAIDSGFCGQVRTIVGKNKNGEIIVNAPWLGFSDDLDDNDEVRGKGVTYQIFPEWGEVIGFTTREGVRIITNPFPEDSRWMSTLDMCDYHQTVGDTGCIISTASDANRMYFLYENGYIRYGGVGMNKFFLETEGAMFAGKDKSAIVSYRDVLLAFGKKKIAVGLFDDTGTYGQIYNQSVSVGLKNRYAYGEYNGDMLFVSNDNRLLSIQFDNSVGNHMLNFQDVGAYANSFLSAMLPTDEAFIGVDDNKLRIFINSMSDMDRDTDNSKTIILKYDTTFQVWTVDVLKYMIVNGCYQGLFYGDNVYYRSGYEDIHHVRVGEKGDFEMISRDYQVNISAFLLENEENGMQNSEGALDLFRLASLQKLIVLLGTGRYSDEGTKIKITERRGGRGREYVINNLEDNDWVKMVTYAYNGEQIEDEFLKKKECVIDSLNDGSKQIRVRCKEGHKVQAPSYQTPRCEYERDIPLGEHNVCINDEIYELAPTMPLTIQLGDQENYNTGIKVELISQNRDMINFGGFMALLQLAPLGQNMGGDGEYQIAVDSGC